METTITTPLQQDIENRLAESEPELEVLLAEVNGGLLRVYVDHPDGVSVEMCERATLALGPLRERFALEVSSPGSERPLTRPEHFQRFAGRRARVRTRQALAVGADGQPRASFSGEIVAADEECVTIAAAGAIAAVPYEQISRANLIED